MARAEKEAIVICLDVGKNATEESGGKTFLQRSIDCAKKIIVRKIFAKPNDEIGIILYGCDSTSNDLNNQNCGYENIVEMDILKMPSWTMLEALNDIRAGNASVGWSDCLLVALNYMNNETGAKKFSHLRIILFTNFLTNLDGNDLDIIIENINNFNIELIGVSDSVCNEKNTENWQFSQNPQKNKNQLESERIFEKMTESIDGATLCHIDYVESQLINFQKKTSRGHPWNVALQIGSSLAINVSAYVYIQKAATSSFKTECVEFNTATKMITDYTKNNENIEKPSEDDIIKAYQYGSKMTAVDDSSIDLNSGEKCLAVLSFCKKRECNSNIFAGKGCHVVVPQRDCGKSATLFGSLVKMMDQKGYFMIARKVYRKGTKATIVGLFPQINEDGLSLVMIELPFHENIQRCRFEKFQSKKASKPSDEQLVAMRKLVDAMDLTKAIDDDSGITEAFTMETSPNPFHQHICKTVTHRALNPNVPLPTFDDELKKMIDVPEKLKTDCSDIFKEIERLFPLEIVQNREKKVFGQKIIGATQKDAEDVEMTDATQAESNNEPVIIAVGTVNPSEDFLHLVHKKTEKFNVLCEQIQSVIHEFIFKSTIDLCDKIQEAILAYRDTAKIHGPFNYNTWITDLKTLMIKRNKIDEWNKYIVKEGLGLITINESPISTVTIEENLEFYEIVSKETSNISTVIHPEDDELENLL